MTTLPPSDPSVQFTPLAREGAWREGRASLKPAGKAAQLSWRSVMALMLLALATAHIPQPAAAQTCTAPPNCKAQGKALTWNGTAWECISRGRFTNVYIGIPFGTVNLDNYLPSGYTAAFLTACGPDARMDGIQVAYYSAYNLATCGAIVASPGTHTFTGSSWFAITGYWD